MTTLFITRGLPGSGKTYWARQYLAERQRGTVIRLNRDDLRRMGLPTGYGAPEPTPERAVTVIRDSALSALLAGGIDVICDDTNLRGKWVQGLLRIADGAGAVVEFVDFTEVPLELCIERDAGRHGVERVGEEVIRLMHRKFLAQHKGRVFPVPVLPGEAGLDVVPYVPRPDTPKVFLCDLDGTVALLNGRDPYDESCVSGDVPNHPVVETVRALVASGLRPVFMSGRTEACREATAEWLITHVVRPVFMVKPHEHTTASQWVDLYMRQVGDTRADQIVKLELFDRHIRDRYDVQLVLDDRSRVVRMWRRLGLVVFQVAPGDF